MSSSVGAHVMNLNPFSFPHHDLKRHEALGDSELLSKGETELAEMMLQNQPGVRDATVLLRLNRLKSSVWLGHFCWGRGRVAVRGTAS